MLNGSSTLSSSISSSSTLVVTEALVWHFTTHAGTLMLRTISIVIDVTNLEILLTLCNYLFVPFIQQV